MSFNAASLRLMAEKGLTLADAAEIAEAMEVRRDPTAAVRQQRRRDKMKAERDEVTRDVTRDVPPYEGTSTPRPVPSGAEAPSVTVLPRKPDLFVCPEGVDPTHWRDFMENRKRKHCAKTETAYQGILSDLAKHADDDWPPGRLVQHAAAKGWASINDPRTPLGNHQNGQPGTAVNLRGPRPSPALDMLKRAAAEESAASGDQAPGRGTWPSLPAVGAGGP